VSCSFGLLANWVMMVQKKARVLVILCLAQLGAMLIWYNFAAIVPILQTEWHMNNEQVGTILSGFQLGYVIAVFFTGWLSDKTGGKLVFTICSIQTGVASLGFIFFAHDYSSALLWRTLAGIGQGGLYVPGMHMLSAWYGPHERGRAIGIYTCSMVGAYAGAYYVAAPLASFYSWQTAVFWTSVWAFLAAALVHFALPAGTGTTGVMSSDITEHKLRKSRSFIHNRAMWLVIGGYMGHMWELYAFWGWVGTFSIYVLTIKGIENVTAIGYGGMIAASCILVGGLAPGLAGWMSDKYGRSIVAMVSLVISSCCAIIIGWLVWAPLWLFLIVGLIYGFFIVADSAVFKAGITELVSLNHLGSALGIQSVLGFGVTVLSPKIFGAILDTYGWGWAFVMLGIGPIAGSVCMLVLRQIPECRQMAGGKG